MADIKFDGEIIWSSSDGTYDFTPGMMSRRWISQEMLRADGEISKRGGLSGCDHSLTLRFHSVAVPALAGVFSAMDDLARSLNEGDLEVPDYGVYPNCTVRNVQPGAQTAGLKNLDIDTLEATKAYTLQFEITLRQSRP